MKAELEPIPDYGQHMPIQEFIDACKKGLFIDSDGFGNYATPMKRCKHLTVSPLNVVKPGYRPPSSHVVWFKK